MDNLIGEINPPKVLTRGSKTYIFVKEYTSFYLYEESVFGYKQCFCKNEFTREMVKPVHRRKWEKPNPGLQYG